MKKHVLTDSGGLLAPAYVANGFIGFRFGPDTLRNPLPGRLSGYDMHHKNDIGTCAPIPTPSLVLKVDGNELLKDEYRFVRQTYDFSCGELETEYAVKTRGGKSATVKHLVFCSRTSPTLLVYRVTVTAEDDMRFGVCEKIEFPAPNRILESTTDYAGTDFTILFTADGGNDKAGLASLTLAYTDDVRKTYPRLDDEKGIAFRWIDIPVAAGSSQYIDAVTSFVPGCMHTEPQHQALRELKLFLWEGYDSVHAKNRKAWQKLWESRIEIEGDEIMQDTADASYFYMMSSVHRSAPFSIGPFALSSDGYFGHAFWDTDSFMFMIPLLVEPEAARSLLEYRYARLGMAINNAKLNGYPGAQYPWQSGRYGDEVTPTWAGQAAGAGEQHINLDVAMAFVAYCRATDDDIFVKEKVWPVIREIAAWICGRAEKTGRGYEILHICGIDEESDNVNNDGYTNMMSKLVLRAACEIAEELGFKPPKKWREVESGLVLAFDEEHRYLKKHEDSVIQPIMTSETLMAFFPYGFSHSPEVDRNTIQMFLDHGFEDGLRYPMLSNFLAVYPAMLGDRKRTRAIYDDVREKFFVEPYLASSEWGYAKEYVAKGKMPETIFMTARGSLLCGLMMGLTRMNFWQGDPEKWFTRPVCLPEGWTKLTLGKIFIGGRAARVTAVHGEIPVVEWLE